MNATDPLVRLLGVLEPSLLMYLSDSGIWSYPGDEAIKLALADVVGDQRNLIERAGVVLEERDVSTPRVAYPLAFTAGHDLDLRYLLPRVIEGLRRQLPALEQIAATATADATAAGLAREALAATGRHIGILEELQVRLRAGLSGRPAGTGAPAGPAAS